MEVVEVNIFKDTDAKSQLSMLDRLWQAECRLERSYARAQRELQRLQKSRPAPVQQPEDPPPAPVAEATVPLNAEPPSEIQHPASEIHPSSEVGEVIQAPSSGFADRI